MVLLDAVKSGNLAIVNKTLQCKWTDINTFDSDGRFPLYLASENGHTEIVKILLKQDKINVTNQRSGDNMRCSSSIMIASHNGHAEIVQLLLDHPDVDINEGDSDGRTPLYCASWKNHIQVVQRLLIQTEIDVNKAQTRTGATPLYIASELGNTQVVELLLDKTEIDVNKAKTDASGETPLTGTIRFALQYSNSKPAKLLLAHPGIDVNKKRTSDEATPLWVAANLGDLAAGKHNIFEHFCQHGPVLNFFLNFLTPKTE